MRHLRDAETADPPLNDIGLAVSEAVTNVVQHAYTETAAGEFRVAVNVGDEEISVLIEDDGAGMRPRPDSPGLGLGLPLIATLAERVDTQAFDGGGTRLCMWFTRHVDGATLPG